MKEDDVDFGVLLSHHLHKLEYTLGNEEASFWSLFQALECVRACAGRFILKDFDTAPEDAEDQVWNAHLKVHQRLRGQLRKLNEGGNVKVVERRKCGADYLRFVKSSQKFYRSYIKSLHEICGGIKPLERLADKFSHDDALSTKLDAPSSASTAAEKVIRSCYRSLIQLGDLSRYRETELAKNNADWSPAVGFYDLARALVPSSGISYNQLAIIALADNDLFRAIYWLYRALAVQEPHPQADQNLRRAFSKVSLASFSGSLWYAPTPTVIARFLDLLSTAQLGEKAPNSDALEVFHLRDLSGELQSSKDHGKTLCKLFLINFASTQHAQEVFTKTKGAQDSYDTLILTLRLTIMSCSTLFAEFATQLDAYRQENQTHTDYLRYSKEASITIPRLVYLTMLWMTKNRILLTNSVHADVDDLQAQLWENCARCLSPIVSASFTTPAAQVTYLLPEEEDTLAFTPLLCESTTDVWVLPYGQQKLTVAEVNTFVTQADQMLHRLIAIKRVALRLAEDESVILSFMAIRGNHPEAAPPTQPQHAGEEDDKIKDDNVELEAERMVDNLVQNENEARTIVEQPSGAKLIRLPSSDKQTDPYAVDSSTNARMLSAARQASAGDTRQAAATIGAHPQTALRRDSISPQARTSFSSMSSTRSPNLRPPGIPTSHQRLGHSRAVSNESGGSFASASGPRRSSLAIPDTGENGHDASNVLLFGAGQSQWSMTEPESKRLSDAHVRVSNSPRLMPKALASPFRRQSFGLGAEAWNDPENAETRPAASPIRFNVHARPFK